MELSERFLPNEKLIKEYTNLSVNNNSNGSLFITNLRLFIVQNDNQFWDLRCENIDYLERTFIHRFSSWWQLLLLPISLVALTNGNFVLFVITSILSMARQYIKIESLIIQSKTNKWSFSDSSETLDEITKNIQMNTFIGIEIEEGKQILDAEELDHKEKSIEVKLIGENESRPFKSAWILAIMSFFAYYMSSFGIDSGFLIFLFTISSLGSFIIYRDRKITNKYREVEPKAGFTIQLWHFFLKKINVEIIKAKWSFKLMNKDIEVRKLGYYVCCVFLFLGFLITYAEENMIPLLLGITIGTPIYLSGRALAGIPRSKKRMLLRSAACFAIALIIMIPCLVLMPLYESANAQIPDSIINDDEKGWEKSMNQREVYGLGLLSTTFILYTDDGENSEGESDGYPAILFVIALKLPFDLDEKDALTELDKQFNKMAIDQEIELDAELETGSRVTKQGYETQYIIYNGTAKTEQLGVGELNYSVTKGAESRYIGEVWKAPEQNLLIVTIGLAIISSESLNDNTGVEPIDNLIDDFIPNPTDSTDTKNWIELQDLILEVVCFRTD